MSESVANVKHVETAVTCTGYSHGECLREVVSRRNMQKEIAGADQPSLEKAVIAFCKTHACTEVSIAGRMTTLDALKKKHGLGAKPADSQGQRFVFPTMDTPDMVSGTFGYRGQ